MLPRCLYDEIILFSVCFDCFLCVAESSAKIRCGIVVFTDLGIQTQQHLMNEAPNTDLGITDEAKSDSRVTFSKRLSATIRCS